MFKKISLLLLCFFSYQGFAADCSDASGTTVTISTSCTGGLSFSGDVTNLTINSGIKIETNGKGAVSIGDNTVTTLTNNGTIETTSTHYGLRTQTQEGFTLTSQPHLTTRVPPLGSSVNQLNPTTDLATSIRFLHRANLSDNSQVVYNSLVYIATGDSSDTTNPVIAYGKNEVVGLFFDTLNNFILGFNGLKKTSNLLKSSI